MRTYANRSRLRSSNRHVSPDGLLVLTGYGVRVSVERGHLAFSDGLGRDRREGRLSRATAGLRRLVVLGHSGLITFEAQRWLHDVGAAFVHIDADGRVITVSVRQGLNDARLRRAQAIAISNGVGVTIGRELTRRKLDGQANVLSQRPNSERVVALIRQCIDELTHARTPSDLRVVEAVAAAAYWSELSSAEVQFARRDRERVPVHWTTFGARTSPLTDSPRNAGNPANAILNYLYAILEAEASIAALTIGLDPGMGLLHADLKARDSLACDLMEVVRPEVDRLWLQLLEDRIFGARDFFETRTGVCRLVAPLPKMLAEYSDTIRRLISRVAEQVAADLLRSVRSPSLHGGTVPTLLTQARRTAARPVRNAPPRERTRLMQRGCVGCGVGLKRRDRQHCDECIPELKDRQYQDYVGVGAMALAALRESGKDPAHGGSAAKKRGATAAAHLRENAEWEAEHGAAVDPEEFRREILPRLQRSTVNAIARATGLSLRYSSLVRRGERVPHPRHWEVLRLD